MILKPKDVRVPPASMYVWYKVQQFEEFHILRNWVSQWGKYLSWYCTCALDPWIRLDYLFKGPLLNRNFMRDQIEPELVCFGFLMKFYDFVGAWCSPESWALTELLTKPGFTKLVYLIGGEGNTSSLVYAIGLYLPKAGGGVISYSESLEVDRSQFAEFVPIFDEDSGETHTFQPSYHNTSNAYR